MYDAAFMGVHQRRTDVADNCQCHGVRQWLCAAPCEQRIERFAIEQFHGHENQRPIQVELKYIDDVRM